MDGGPLFMRDIKKQNLLRFAVVRKLRIVESRGHQCPPEGRRRVEKEDILISGRRHYF